MSKSEYQKMIDGMTVDQFEREIASRREYAEGYHFRMNGLTKVNPYPENTLESFIFESGAARFID